MIDYNIAPTKTIWWVARLEAVQTLQGSMGSSSDDDVEWCGSSSKIRQQMETLKSLVPDMGAEVRSQLSLHMQLWVHLFFSWSACYKYFQRNVHQGCPLSSWLIICLVLYISFLLQSNKKYVKLRTNCWTWDIHVIGGWKIDPWRGLRVSSTDWTREWADPDGAWKGRWPWPVFFSVF